MNCFGPCGDNTCLWILIILLIICCCGTSFIENICNSCYLPVILALLYCVCKKGGLPHLFGGCGCGCK